MQYLELREVGMHRSLSNSEARDISSHGSIDICFFFR